MTKNAKVWLIIGASLFIIGVLVFAVAMTLNGWDFRKLSTVKYERETYKIADDFNSVVLKTDTADIKILPSEDESCSVICYEETNAKHSVCVKDGVLNITLQNQKKWYEYIGINFDSTKLTVYLPKSEYDALSIMASTSDVEIAKNFDFHSVDISVSTGDINIENITTHTLDITVSTGDITLDSVNCQSLISRGSTGDITLKDTVAQLDLFIKRSTGDIRLERSDAATIYIKTDTGDITGTVLEDRHFDVVTNTGDVRVPKEGKGGNCQIITNTGDILIDIAK